MPFFKKILRIYYMNDPLTLLIPSSRASNGLKNVIILISVKAEELLLTTDVCTHSFRPLFF